MADECDSKDVEEENSNKSELTAKQKKNKKKKEAAKRKKQEQRENVIIIIITYAKIWSFSCKSNKFTVTFWKKVNLRIVFCIQIFILI